MKDKTKSTTVSNLQILQVISDKVTLDIFNAIAKNPETSDSLEQKLDLTYKVYYSRAAKLLRSNIIKREGGKYLLTSFGKLIHEAQLKIASAVELSRQLRLVDSVMSNIEIPYEERKEVIDKMIDNPLIKALILNHPINATGGYLPSSDNIC